MTARARPTSAFARARAAFAAAPRPAGAKISNRAKVRAMLDDIRAKRAAGWSYEEIRRALARTVGFTGTLNTLYNYVSCLSADRRADATVEGAVLPTHERPSHARHASRSQPRTKTGV